MGAARYTADRRAGAMHGKIFLCDSLYAGIDENNVYGRLDFVDGVPESDFEVVVNLESWSDQLSRPRRALRLNATIESRTLSSWNVSEPDSAETVVTTNEGVAVALARSFEFKMPLALLLAVPVASSAGNSRGSSTLAATKLRVRFSIWQNRLPVDALPVEGWIELHLLSEEDLMSVSQ
jgi:hypothetical protein